MTKYYLFGETAIKLFENNELADKIKEGYTDYALYKYNTCNDPTELLEAFNGWSNYIELDLKSYEELKEAEECTIIKEEKEFFIEIRETLLNTYRVSAINIFEAEQKIQKCYNDEIIVLDSQDFGGVEFIAVDEENIIGTIKELPHE